MLVLTGHDICLLWFNFLFGLIFPNQFDCYVSLPIIHRHTRTLEKREIKISQTDLENFKAEINLNQNMYMTVGIFS